ncbi:MAG TPA: metalloregulator ArsR/SmtB family transcription factor [bacterium]|nr:metalloregulator ArsR/SmtB family transcription factor [bacterium]
MSMPNNGDAAAVVDPRALELAQALADPLRLTILHALMGGPAAVSEIVSATGEAQPKVSNHLALLRQRGLVRATRVGRQIVYELRDPSVGRLVESLSVVAGASRPAARKSAPIVNARTCYDHLAGRLGVAVFDALVTRRAIVPPGPSGGPVELGPAGAETFGALGVDPAALRRQRRQFATACLDWTERRPHLGGALGAALWAKSVERGWVVRRPGTRAVLLTDTGRRALHRTLGIKPAAG